MATCELGQKLWTKRGGGLLSHVLGDRSEHLVGCLSKAKSERYEEDAEEVKSVGLSGHT